MSYQSFDQSSVQSMNRCTGPAPCHCPITGPHQDDNAACPRNVLATVLASRRKANASGQDGEDSAQIVAAASGVQGRPLTDSERMIEAAAAGVLAVDEEQPPCPVCGGTERSRAGYLLCECPAASLKPAPGVAPVEVPSTPSKPLTRCAAGSDGDCVHPQCPQLRDSEPKATGRHCPIDNREDDYT